MSTLSSAIDLCKTDKNSKEFLKGIEIFKKIILNRVLPETSRIKAIVELSKVASDEAVDTIVRLRDSLPFLTGEELDCEVKMISALVEHPFVNSHERLLCALCLYNHNYIEICYDLFIRLASDPSVLVDYRLEATRYLVYSDIKSHIKIARKALTEIISSKEYTSEYRYKAIAGFITYTGLSTFLNLEKLNVAYNEKLLYALQTIFFWENANEVRYRILSGQHMLGMTEKRCSTDEKNKIIEELLRLGAEYNGEGLELEQDQTPDEFADMIDNIKADCLDVVLRMGLSAEQRMRSQQLINNLGFSMTNGKRVRDLSQKVRTVYTDRQSVHNHTINDSVNDFINKFFKDKENKRNELDSYQSIHSEITEMIYSKLNSKNRIKAFKSLNRISIDTATFGILKITTAEIFVYVWKLISKHEKDEKELLKSRMIDELVDMADTCSSGHSSRLINVLQGFDGVEIKISFRDQIISNMGARMQKKIKNITDAELQEKVVIGITTDAEPEDRDAFIKFITNNIPSLKEELYKEFVGGDYVSETDFNNIFEEGVNKWM